MSLYKYSNNHYRFKVSTFVEIVILTDLKICRNLKVKIILYVRLINFHFFFKIDIFQSIFYTIVLILFFSYHYVSNKRCILIRVYNEGDKKSRFSFQSILILKNKIRCFTKYHIFIDMLKLFLQ